MTDFNNPVIDTDEVVLNTMQNIFDNEEPTFHRQVISRPNADLWQSAVEAELDAHWHNHTWDILYRPTNTIIVDSKWVFKIKRISDRSVDKFKA
jgi:hypothetical protein